MNKTENQIKILEGLNNSDNMIINAIAGSGKTTTLMLILEEFSKDKRYGKDSILFSTFSKDMSKEISEKLKSESKVRSDIANVSTTYSLGLNLLRKMLPNCKLVTGGGKNGGEPELNMIKSFHDIKDLDYEGKLIFETLFKATSSTILEHKKKYILHTIDDKDVFNDLINNCDISKITSILEKPDDFGELVKLMKSWYTRYKNTFFKMVKENKVTQISFADMIYLPPYLNEVLGYDYPRTTYKIGLLDECQDLSDAQFKVFLGALNGKRFIAVGDENQAIFGFAGANIESFNNIKKMCTPYKLSDNFRCPKVAEKIVGDIYPNMEFNCFKQEEGQFNPDDSLDSIREGDLVIVRRTVTGIRAYLELVKKGYRVRISGDDGKKIVSDVKNLFKKYSLSSQVLRYLKNKMKVLLETKPKTMNVSKLTFIESDPEYMYYNRLYVIIEVLSKEYNSRQNVIKHLEIMFDDKQTGKAVKIYTAHKCKGLQNKRVFILNPKEFPIPNSNLKQERNLWYVANTRFEEYMGWIDFEEYMPNLNYYEEPFYDFSYMLSKN